jgi:hypothetical protein
LINGEWISRRHWAPRSEAVNALRQERFGQLFRVPHMTKRPTAWKQLQLPAPLSRDRSGIVGFGQANGESARPTAFKVRDVELVADITDPDFVFQETPPVNESRTIQEKSSFRAWLVKNLC